MNTKTITINIKVFVNEEIEEEQLDNMKKEIENDFANYLRSFPQNNKTIMGSIVKCNIDE